MTKDKVRETSVSPATAFFESCHGRGTHQPNGMDTVPCFVRFHLYLKLDSLLRLNVSPFSKSSNPSPHGDLTEPSVGLEVVTAQAVELCRLLTTPGLKLTEKSDRSQL